MDPSEQRVYVGPNSTNAPVTTPSPAVINAARPRQIRDCGEHREDGGEDDGAEDESRRVLDPDRFEGELTDAAPEEQVLDDREARDRNTQTAAECLQQHRSNVRKHVNNKDPAPSQALRVRDGDEVRVEHVDHPRGGELRGERDRRERDRKERQHEVLRRPGAAVHRWTKRR